MNNGKSKYSGKINENSALKLHIECATVVKYSSDTKGLRASSIEYLKCFARFYRPLDN